MSKTESAYARNAAIYDTTIGWRFINSLMKKLYDTHSMPQTADNVAQEFSISRANQEVFPCVRSSAGPLPMLLGALLMNWCRAKKGDPVVFDTDEHPHPEATLEMPSKIKAVNGADLTVTAGNASDVNDGVCALLLALATDVKAHGLTPKDDVVVMATAGVLPRSMGFGPALTVLRRSASSGR